MGKVLLSGISQILTVPSIAKKILNDNTWDIIKQISDAGQAANYWSVGDTKDIVLNGTVGFCTFTNYTVKAVILGFNHNSSLEGANTIHFTIGKNTEGTDICFCDSEYWTTGYYGFRMQHTNNSGESSNRGGWRTSYMRGTIMPQFLASFPSDLRSVVKPITKYTDNNYDGVLNYAGAVFSLTENCFLASEFEIQGVRTRANQYEQDYQKQYDYYKNGNSKIRYRHDDTATAVHRWTRSADYSFSGSFVFTASGGASSTRGSIYSMGVSPCFCV